MKKLIQDKEIVKNGYIQGMQYYYNLYSTEKGNFYSRYQIDASGEVVYNGDIVSEVKKIKILYDLYDAIRVSFEAWKEENGIE